jgi:hypothetical protein
MCRQCLGKEATVSATPKTRDLQPVPFRLTLACERVQCELLDLADALRAAALDAYPDLAKSFLAAAAHFRRHLRDHVTDVENPTGLFVAIVQSEPRLEPEIDCLCAEHAALEGSVDALAALLERFDPADGAAAGRIREAAEALAAMVRRHQQSAAALANSACCGRSGVCKH